MSQRSTITLLAFLSAMIGWMACFLLLGNGVLGEIVILSAVFSLVAVWPYFFTNRVWQPFVSIALSAGVCLVIIGLIAWEEGTARGESIAFAFIGLVPIWGGVSAYALLLYFLRRWWGKKKRTEHGLALASGLIIPGIAIFPQIVDLVSQKFL